MKAILLLAPLALAACAAGGGWKSPAQMTPDELCMNAELTYGLMQANGVEASILERARVNMDLLCAP
jgi:hypothetical protein